jgi:hypothetical protein
MKGVFQRAAALAAVLALGACTETPQTATTTKKVDAKPWQGASSPYTAPGWQQGDEASWEQQLRNRTQGQNDYSRGR